MFFIAKLTYGCVTFTLSIIFCGWYTYDDISRFQRGKHNLINKSPVAVS
jgi:hypothetical protein